MISTRQVFLVAVCVVGISGIAQASGRNSKRSVEQSAESRAIMPFINIRAVRLSPGKTGYFPCGKL
jgi:hypothetical protein